MMTQNGSGLDGEMGMDVGRKGRGSLMKGTSIQDRKGGKKKTNRRWLTIDIRRTGKEKGARK